jgi:o-succinylbenzoate synthase
MKIAEVEIYLVAMPLIEPFRTAFGTVETIESVFVHMITDDAEGWGESTPQAGPFYSAEWARGCFTLIRDWLAPIMVGKEVASGQELQRLLAPVKGNFFAKAALDLAWWDAYARALGRPMWRLIGGANPSVDVGEDIGLMDSVDALLGRVDQAQRAGMKRIKIKVMPGWDMEILSRVREAHPAAVIHIDCNGAYSLNDLPRLREFDHFGLAMIEQPLAHDDLVDHARLQRELSTPLCLDECIVSVAKARKAIELGAARWINIKLGRVGGLTNAIDIHSTCVAMSIPCWAGFMIESALGQAQTIALATLPNMRYPADIFPSRRFYHEDLSEPEIEMSGPSAVCATDEIGFGRKPNPRRLAKQTIDTAIIRRTST